MADPNFTQYLRGAGQGFNPFGAGNKVYGGGRSAPNIGPVGNREGYEERDRMARAKRNAMLQRLKAGQQGKFMSQPWLRGNSNGTRTR